MSNIGRSRQLLITATLLAAQTGCDRAQVAAETSVKDPDTAATLRQSHITLALVIDQFPLWEAIERIPELPPGGGLSRLAKEANATAELRFGYVQTSTAMGHSALFTGLTPHASHITSNEILRQNGSAAAIVSDPETRLIGPEGVIERIGVSLAALAADRETIADALRRQRPEVTIACISMKDRGAVFACGRSPDAVLWFDVERDAFVTSTAFADSFPPMLASFGEPGMGASYRRVPWQPSDESWLKAHSRTPAPDLGQGDFEGLGAAFPHDFAKTRHPARAMLASPMADELLTDLALTVLDSLADDRDAFVAISFSAHDYVSHVFGPASPEAWDELLRLDEQIGRLYARLDELYSPSGYSIVLSGDHGGPPAPEGPRGEWCNTEGLDRFERPCQPAIRLLDADLTKRAREVAAETLGHGAWILGTSEPFVVFTEAAKALPTARLDRLVTAEIEALRRLNGVAQVVDTRGTGARECPDESDDSMPALVCRSLAGDAHGSLLVVPARGAFFDSGYVEGDGCNHGTPYLFDRTVPLFVRAPLSPRSTTRHEPPLAFDAANRVDQRAYARTLAAFLEIEPISNGLGADLSGR